MSVSKDFPDCFYRVSIKALVQDGNKFLLGHNKAGPWEWFGGGLDFDETPREALSREIAEETGCTLLSMSETPTLVLPRKVLNKRDMEWFHNCPIFYRAEVDLSTFDTSLQYSEYAWFTIDEIQTIPLWQGEEGAREGFKVLA